MKRICAIIAILTAVSVFAIAGCQKQEAPQAAEQPAATTPAPASAETPTAPMEAPEQK